jgi:hypothetical protein
MSKDREYNIHVVAKEVEKTRQNLDTLAVAVNNLTDKIDASNKKQADGYTKAEAKGESLFGKLAKWAMGYVGVQTAISAVTKAIEINSRAMEENAAIIERQQQSLLRLQFLGDYYKERPELRKEVAGYAEMGRRSPEEVAGAMYNLRSKAGKLSETQQRDILTQALETGRTDPSMPLDTLVDMYSLYSKLTGATDANRTQNVLQRTIEQAGGTGADVANYMPQFLPIGLSGGLSGAESAGLWAYATTQTASPAIATTGLRATFMGLQGKGSPEGQKRLAELGIDPAMPFRTKIQILAKHYAAGKLSLADAEQIAGREGASIMLSLAQNPAAMEATIGSVVAADTGSMDITKDMITGLMGSDDVAKTEENNRLLKVATENQKAQDVEAVKIKEAIQANEYRNRKLGSGEVGIAVSQGIIKTAAAILPSETFLDVFGPGDPNTMEDLQGKGLYPKDMIINNVTNQNIVYNRQIPAAKPRVSPGDVQ